MRTSGNIYMCTKSMTFSILKYSHPASWPLTPMVNPILLPYIRTKRDISSNARETVACLQFMSIMDIPVNIHNHLNNINTK